jgi:pimeloyl-ACP methyl ester carboxylesterase
MYERALPLLGAGMQAYAFDTPGYGGSSPLADEASIPGYAVQLVAAIEALGIDRTAVCGFATGSAVAVEVVRRLGTRATHLILSGTPVLSPARFDAFGVRLGRPDRRADGSHLLQVWNSRVENYGVGNDLDQVAMAVSETLRVYERMHWGLLAVQRYDLRAALAALDLPTLFLTAAHDKLAPENREAAALVRGAEEVFVADAQPQLCWTDPSRFRDEVFRFTGIA